MPSVYIDSAGDIRSTNSGRMIAPAGTTAREARMKAALWAATAEVLKNAATTGTSNRSTGMPAVAAPTPITSAPSYPTTTRTADGLTVISGHRLSTEVAAALTAHHNSPHLEENPACH